LRKQKRPVVKSVKLDAQGNPQEYKPWGDAKNDLVDEIGAYCSYCEKKVNPASLHVEHVRAKSLLRYANLKYRWDNFLLTCSNCNGIKGSKDIADTNPFLPHVNNLLHFLEVIDGGLIKIKDGVEGENLERTRAFIELVGLDREPTHKNYSLKDDRWESRLDTKNVAQRYYDKYTATPASTDVETIVDLAKAYGFFAVWYYQFLGFNEVLDALINGVTVNDAILKPFAGTDVNSFDAQNFTTLERP
jgi:uncharacterized protein (TIGR02646 family)